MGEPVEKNKIICTRTHVSTCTFAHIRTHACARVHTHTCTHTTLNVDLHATLVDSGNAIYAMNVRCACR